MLLWHNGYSQKPDYDSDRYWLALPWKNDMADKVPQGCNCLNKQSEAVADVFYIHPTTFYFRGAANDRLRLPSTHKLNKQVLLYQASVFNECFAVFAPLYRQVSHYEMRELTEKSMKARELAYQDIKKAFTHFLAAFNNNRPFVIAAHGQGSQLGFRLIADMIDTDSALAGRFIAAYLPGYIITPAQLNSLKQINYGHSPTDTKCIISWQTIGIDGYKDDMTDHSFIYKNNGFKKYENDEILGINPLTWSGNDTTRVNEIFHLGSAKPARRHKLAVVMENYLSVGLSDGWAVISKPKAQLFNATGKNYHVYDYNLFYLNIRHNACQRLATYLDQNKSDFKSE